ncbi:MAG TPA: amidohydrolase family protein [Novosphingobium sp.]|nr:amidohydrolase family protein [Novosphingobium sp.]
MSGAPASVSGADTLIRNAMVVTMDADRRVFTDGWLAMRGGVIAGVGAMATCPPIAGPDAPRAVVDARGGMVMPGMVNAHNHLIQIAFRGYNDDRWPVLDIPGAVRALMRQLFALAGRLDGERARAIVRLHALDLLKNGYTATHDEHFTNVLADCADGAFAGLAESGMRGFLTRCICDAGVPEEGRETVEAGLAQVERLHATFASDRLRVAAGFLNFNFRARPETMGEIRRGALALGVPFGVDMTDNARGATLRARGYEGGQVEYYRDQGLLDDGPIYAGKAVHVLPHEWAILAQRDCRLGLVPVLRFFDGVGVPAHHMLAAGLLPGIGTDAPLVSDSQNPFEIMRQLILAQNLWLKRSGEDKPAPDLWLNAERVLEMATLGGARALLMEQETGALVPGMAADVVVIDTARATLAPSHGRRRAVGALVWGGQGADVRHVFVAGTQLIANGRSTRWDEEAIVTEAEAALAAIARETELDTMLPPRMAGHSYREWRYE